MELNKLSAEIYQANKEKGFWNSEEIVQKMVDLNEFTMSEISTIQKAIKMQKSMLIVSELSEAVEAERKNLMDDKLSEHSGFEVEIADAMIRIFDLAGGYGIDLDIILQKKLDYNKTRPYLHGKKC